MDLSVAKWLETEAYQTQKELINRETNENKAFRNYARPRLDAPREYARPDYAVFEKSKEELEETLTVKFRHKKELQDHYGKDWKRHLNIPSKELSQTIKLTF